MDSLCVRHCHKSTILHEFYGAQFIFLQFTLLEKGKPVNLPFRVNLHVEGKKKEVFKGTGIVTVNAIAPEYGFIYASGSYRDGKKRSAHNFYSVAVNPEKIRQGMPEPPDFDVFWDAAQKDIAAMPMNTSIEPVPVNNPELKDKVNCFEVRLDAPGKRRAFGYLSMPKDAKAGSLPALIIFDGAGIYVHKQDNAVKFAGKGFLVLSVNAHGVEYGENSSLEALLAKMKKRRYYSVLDWDKPKVVPFYDMIVRDLRGLQYLKSRSEWDGWNLICYGDSQGGAQSLAVAGLSPEVTFCYAGVPGLCNHGGIEKKQARGWPGNFRWNAKTKVTAGYLDNCNFAARIKCPVLVTAAWNDYLTKPSTVYAAYNNISSPKELIPYPDKGHWPAIVATREKALKKITEYLKK